MSRRLLLAMTLGACLMTVPAAAQEVQPRWMFEGRGLLSSALEASGTGDLDPEWALVEWADTEVVTRVDQALFSEAILGFALGARLTDRDSPLAPVYLHQIAGAFQSRHVVAMAGRSRRPVLGVSFPTLRDEDLLTLLYPLNPFSVGGLEEDVLFSEQLALTGRLDFRWHAEAFVESLRDTVETGDPGERTNVAPNAYGGRLYFDELPALSKVARVKHAGVGLFVPDLARLWQLRAVGSMNLFPDPIHLVDLRVAALFQRGRTDDAWDDLTDAWRGQYVGGAAALRYLWAPYQLERLQLALNGGYRRYTDRDAAEWAVIPSLVWRLGVNVDVGAQYAFWRRSGDLAQLEGRTEHVGEVILNVRFEVLFNDTITLPRDLLNAEYGYVPVN